MNKAFSCFGLPLATVLLATASLQGGQPVPPQAPEPPKALVLARGGSFLGVGVSEIDSERAKVLNLREERGVEVTRLEEDGPAARGGIKVGDVVLDYAGQPVQGTEQFVRLVHETPAGREVKVLLSRNGTLQTVSVKIGVRKAALMRPEGFHIEIPEMPEFQIPDIPKTYMSWRSTVLGVEAESVESQLAQYFGVKEGVLVRSVIKGSAAEKAGLKAGDVITKVDSTPVASPREISKIIRLARAKKTVSLSVVRERREMTMSVPLEDFDPDRAGSGSIPPRKAVSVSFSEH